MVAQSQERSATARAPSFRSVHIEARAAATPRSRACTRISRTAETTKVAASSAKATAPPTPRTRAVASAGLAKVAISRLTPPSAWADWISASGTVCGTSPV